MFIAYFLANIFVKPRLLQQFLSKKDFVDVASWDLDYYELLVSRPEVPYSDK